MTSVPNQSAATVAQAKIQAFLLNSNHGGNKGRAKFFALFGFSADGWETMRDALLAHLAANPTIAIETTMHGTNYTVRCSMPSPDGRNPCINSVWTIDARSGPRFVTAFPGPPPRATA